MGPDSDIELTCHFCEGKAYIKGRWAKARVCCRDCGMEMPLSFYSQELEKCKEKMLLEIMDSCSLQTGDESSGAK